MKRAELSATLYDQFAEADRFEAAIKRNPKRRDMGDNKRKKHTRKFGKQIRWNALKWNVKNTFPAQEDYYDSHWHDWEERIKDDHDAEEKRIRILREQERQSNPDGYLDDDLAEEYIKTCKLTNNMYAALIVSIWSAMEHFLKRLIPSHLEKKIKFDSFDSFKKSMEKELKISVDQCKEYSTINAIRYLNNLFKHEDGYCDPEEMRYGEIKKSKLGKRSLPDWRKRDTRWVGKKIEIDYSKLSISGLVEACNSFCNDLMRKVEKKDQNNEVDSVSLDR